MADKAPKANLPDPSTAWGRWVTDNLAGVASDVAFNAVDIRNVARSVQGTTDAVGEVGQGLEEVKVIPPKVGLVTGNSTASFNSAGILVADIQLFWDPVLDAAGYQIVGGKTGQSTQVLGTKTGSYALDIPDFTMSGLQPGVEYFFQVRAVSAFGIFGEFSDAFVITTSAVGPVVLPPSTPTLATSMSAIAASWDGEDNIGDPMPRWVAGVNTWFRVNAGAWQIGGQFLREAGDSVLTGLTPGDTVDVRFQTVTSWGDLQDGAHATIVVTGVDLGSLDEDVTDAIEAAEAAAAAAQIAADAAFEAANDAATDADAALTAVAGKNKIVWSTNVASGTTGYVAGDLWYRRNASNQIIGVWEFVSGAWVSRTITDEAITNLNAGTITAGTLDAARIAAQSITAVKMRVGDFTNFADGSNFEDSSNIPWTLPAAMTISSTRAYTGLMSLQIAGNASTQTTTLLRPITVDAGESFYFEYNVWRDASWNGTVGSKLRVENQSGTMLFEVDFAAATVPASEWTLRSYVYAVPAGVTGLVVKLISDATAGNAWIDDILIRRMYAGGLLVDGTITTGKLDAEAVTAEKIAASSISAEKIQAEAVISEKIAASAIVAEKIASDAILTNHITAGAVTVSRLEPGIGGLIELDANEFVVSIKSTADATADGLAATNDSIEDMQTVYSFGPTGATITAPNASGELSDTYLELRPDGITLHAAGVEASTWDAAQMYVPSLVGNEVVLGNHKIETYETGTVVRFVGQGG